MKLSNINEWLTLVANLGVLAGIAFLAIEIQQNTNMTRAQTRDSLTEKQMGFYELAINDIQFAEVYATNTGFYTAPEDMQFELFLRSQFRMWENEWYQYRQGLFEEEEFVPRMITWGVLLRNDKYLDFWRRFGDQHAPDFREQIESIISATNDN